MSLENRLPFVESMEVSAVKLRYFAFNCFEMKLPDGKTLVIDPCLRSVGRFFQYRRVVVCASIYVGSDPKEIQLSPLFEKTYSKNGEISWGQNKNFDSIHAVCHAVGEFYERNGGHCNDGASYSCLERRK